MRPGRLLLLGLLLAGAGVGAGLQAGSGRGRRPAPPASPSGGAPAGAQAPEGPDADVSTQRRLDALATGLAWLARAQEADGAYDLARWNPWHGKPGLHGFSEEDHWFGPAATGLAALALLEAGAAAAAHDAALTRALARLLAWQGPDGRIGLDEDEVDRWFTGTLRVAGLSDPAGPGYKARTLHTFNHAVPAAALARALERPDAARWREAARLALSHLVADEHPEYRWSAYLDPETDLGVAAYVALAARAGADAGLAAQAAALLAALPDFLDRVTDPASGRAQMLADLPACFEGHDSTAINAWCRRLAGQDPAAAPLRPVLAALTALPVAWREAALPPPRDARAYTHHLGAVVNHDAFTHAALALEGAPGARAAALRRAIRRLLAEHQVREGEHAGSWEPIGVWDRVGGRLYATAMALRVLARP